MTRQLSMTPRTALTRAAVLRAAQLVKAGSYIADACREVGIDQRTYSRWVGTVTEPRAELDGDRLANEVLAVVAALAGKAA